ncbi:DUF4893 domain-containing protein [Ponticoccus alexandrii]|uniref:DUF4893 domain-containing protein n=1 Tax=Ponticoccus alexandrii TaxID=1943633 RepID=A0ABX7F8V2_9RHOB|nr:DUF4893 domain-containing protein [Ponticoccus alexandrii]QRF66919.1 DUF4893 domain-containing protein [Ponticoccus alexandrii]
MRRQALAIAALVLAAPVTAKDTASLRPADEARMAALDAHFGAAMRQALAGGAPQDIAVLAQAMAGSAGPVTGLAGEWRCRTLKLGEISPLVVYGNFDCRITEAGPGRWEMQKLTGSQHTEGAIVAGPEGTLTYYGVGYVEGGPAVDYSALPPDDQTAVEPGQTVAQPGIVEQVSETHTRVLFPDPILESRFDILYLTR